MDIRRVTDVSELNPVEGDIEIDARGRIVWTNDATGDSTAQKLRIRFNFWRGEYFADTRLGVPYIRQGTSLGILGEKWDEPTFNAIMRNVILTTPGVASLRSYAVTFDRQTRTASLVFTAILVNGFVFDSSNYAPFIVETSA